MGETGTSISAILARIKLPHPLALFFLPGSTLPRPLLPLNLPWYFSKIAGCYGPYSASKSVLHLQSFPSYNVIVQRFSASNTPAVMLLPALLAASQVGT